MPHTLGQPGGTDLSIDIACTQAVKLWKSGASEGMRVPGLIRFVSEETPYLSNSHGGARMFVNLEDHVSHTLKKPNLEFEVRFSDLSSMQKTACHFS